MNKDSVVSFSYKDRKVKFNYYSLKDVIARCHALGKFYEIADLELHRSLIPNRGVVADVGSNVGNHAVFYSLFSLAETVFVFEPNFVARRLLLENLCKNNSCQFVDLQFVKCGLGSEAGFAAVHWDRPKNLGSASLVQTKDGNERVITLDSVFSRLGRRVDFIKIDVEGMELDVLTGARDTIKKYRPVLAVEVAMSNVSKFAAFVKGYRYELVSASRMHRGVLISSVFRLVDRYDG